MQKTCPKCKVSRPKVAFYRCASRPDGLQGHCITCQSAKGKTHYAENTDNYFARRIRDRYGISELEYDSLYKQQNGSCAICTKSLSYKTTGELEKAKIDHNHITGKVRGILCHNCNVILGLAKEDVGRLQKTIDYLNTHKEH